MLTPAIVVRAAGGSEDFLSWTTFAALAISGMTTVLQAVRVGRIGAGHVLLMGTSGTFIAVCVTALVEGGPGLLATLVTVSALFQFRRRRRHSARLAAKAAGHRLPCRAGAVTADGVGNLLSGLAATVPNTTYSSSVSMTEITGVASRTVGVYIEERRLQLSARRDGRAAELEFVAATDETNIEDRIAMLGDRVTGAGAEQEVSLRLLRHLASSVRHQQYHETDVVTVRVEPPV